MAHLTVNSLTIGWADTGIGVRRAVPTIQTPRGAFFYVFYDELSDSTEEDMDLDFSNMPKRQSRRQRGLAPEYELTEMAANDF